MAFLQESGDDKFAFHAKYIGGNSNQKEWVIIVVDSYETLTTAGYFDDWTGKDAPNEGDVLTVFQVTDRRDLSTTADAYRLSVTEWNVSYKLLGARSVRTLAPFYNTVAEAASESISAPAVQILDEASDGDEAAGYYYRTGNNGADVPTHDHYFTDLEGRNFAYLSRRIKLNTIGKVVHSEIVARLEELNAKGGGELQIRDSHLITGSIGGGDDQAENMVIDFGSTGEIVTGAGTNPFVFNFNAEPSAPRDIVLVNPRIDVSAGTGGTGNQGTALGFTRFRKVEVYGGRLFAGDTFDTNSGDTGIAPVAVVDILIDGLSISGFEDNGIYVSGGTALTTDDDGWTCKIVNSSIAYCGNAINSKRQHHNILVQGNAIRFCGQGICSDGADTVQQPGWRYQIIGNFIEKTYHRPIHLKGPTKAIIADNHIKDFGYSADGLTLTTSSPFGIHLDGVVKTHAHGNRIEMLDWVPAAGASSKFHIGLRVNDNADIFGTAYESGQHTFSGNRWRSLDIGIDDDNATHGSVYVNEHFASAVADIHSLHVNSHLTYTTEETVGVTSVGNYPTEFQNGVFSFRETIADDGVASCPLPTGHNTFLITIGTNDTGAAHPNGTIWARANTVLLVDVNLMTAADVTLTTGVLTGTTGVDGDTTLSIHTNSRFYIENRSGAERKYSILVQPTGAA